jgi:hypothetical protein
VKSEVKIKKTLMYYDGPVVFLAEDNVGTNYICQLFERTQTTEKFMCVAMSLKTSSNLLSGSIDLKSIYVNPEIANYFILDMYQENETPLFLEEVDSVNPEWFPDEGLYFKNGFDGNLGAEQRTNIINESIIKNTAIIELSLNPPESNIAHIIEVERLIDGLGIFKNALNQAFKDSIKGLNPRTKKALKHPDNYSVNAFAMSHGSFKVHLQARTQADAAGEVSISKALEKLDEIINSVDDIDVSIEKLKNSNGHFVRAYRNLLEFVIVNNTPLNYLWAVPSSNRPKYSIIEAHKFTPLYDKLVTMKELESVNVTFVGKAIKVDIPNNTWIVETNDGKRISGRLHPDYQASLKGIVVDTKKYKLECEEKIEEEVYNKKQKKIYLLKNIEEITQD